MDAGVVGPVGEVLTVLSAALDGLVVAVGGGGLELLDDAGLVEVLQRFEQVRNRMSVVDHGLVGAVAARGVAERFGQGRVSRSLVQVLRVSVREAARWVRAAEQLGGRPSRLGEEMAPVRPVLAAAQAAGVVSAEQAEVVLRGRWRGRRCPRWSGRTGGRWRSRTRGPTGSGCLTPWRMCATGCCAAAAA